MNAELVQAVAFAIYRTWSRDADPQRAERRFNNLKDAVRRQFEAEAIAALNIVEKYHA